MNTFRLKIIKNKDNGLIYNLYSRELLNHNYLSNNNRNKIKVIKEKEDNLKKIAYSYGWRLKLLEPYIKEIIKYNKQKNKFKNKIQINLNSEKIKLNSKVKNIEIDEENGVRLALLFKATSRIRIMKKIDKILLNIKSMSKEEAYYWYSKVFNNGKKQNGLKALRILIGS